MDSYLQAPDVDLGLVVFNSAKPHVSRVTKLLTILLGSEHPLCGGKGAHGMQTNSARPRTPAFRNGAFRVASANTPDCALALVIVARQNRGQAMQAVG